MCCNHLAPLLLVLLVVVVRIRVQRAAQLLAPKRRALQLRQFDSVRILRCEIQRSHVRF